MDKIPTLSILLVESSAKIQPKEVENRFLHHNWAISVCNSPFMDKVTESDLRPALDMGNSLQPS